MAHTFLSRLSKGISGASSIEYAAIVALIGIALSFASVPLNNALIVASDSLDTGLQIAGGQQPQRASDADQREPAPARRARAADRRQ